MDQVSLSAIIRTKTGKSVARKLRQQGILPAVLYGPKTKSIPLAVNAHDFKKIITKIPKQQVLFTLELKKEGDEEAVEKRTALVKELQLHPVSDEIRHIDFYEVFMDEVVETEVPIKIVGTAKGVETGKGMLELLRRTITISCLPLSIPKEIPVDVSDLDVGDALHVKDLKAEEGIEFVDDPDTTIVTVVPTEAEAVEEEEEEEEEVDTTEESSE